ncbi:UNVERIFIED_CONTAM: hypothetical protein BEN50_25005 [Euhalothece sp. KZN 001]
MAVGSGIAKVRRAEAVVGQFTYRFLRLDLALGIGGKRIERIRLFEIELLTLAIDRARSREQISPDTSTFGFLGESNRGVAVDAVRDLGIEIAHRVVADRSKMTDAVVAFEVPLGQITYILDQLDVRGRCRFPLAAVEKSEVTAAVGVARFLEQLDEMRSDVAAVSGDEYVHWFAFF